MISENSFLSLSVSVLCELVIGLPFTPTIQYGVETYFGEMPRLRVPARKVESFYTLVSECVNPDNQGIS